MAARKMRAFQSANRRRMQVDLGVDPEVGSKVLRSAAAMCDINNIVKRFAQTGQMTHVRQRQALSGDYSEFGDLQANIDRVHQAQEMFDNLPSKVRSHFGNDPVKLVAFMSDPKNADEAVRLGFAKKRDSGQPPPAVPSPQAPADKGDK